MATARILFNDFFHDRQGREFWVIRTKAGNAKPDAEIFATLHNGKLDSVEEFGNPIAGAQMLFLFHNSQNPECDSVGLINNTFGGMAMNTLNNHARIISSGNFLYHEPTDNVPFTDIFINVANDNLSGYISSIFVGCAHDIEVYYPKGWDTPFVQRAENRIKLPKNSVPIGRVSKPSPLSISVPFQYRERDEVRGNIRELIDRMYAEPFLFQYDINDPDHTIFAMLKDHSGLGFTSGGLMDLTLNLEGYVSYDDRPLSI